MATKGMAGEGLKSEKSSPGGRFEGTLHCLLDPLAEEALTVRVAREHARTTRLRGPQ